MLIMAHGLVMDIIIMVEFGIMVIIMGISNITAIITTAMVITTITDIMDHITVAGRMAMEVAVSTEDIQEAMEAVIDK